jgi:hypothetical protein
MLASEAFAGHFGAPAGAIVSSKSLAPTIPAELMRKSPRPGASMTLRLALAGGFALAGLIAAEPVVKGVCLGLSVLVFLAVPFFGDRLLAPIEKEVEAANHSDARKLLRDLTERWAVRWFAPSAWVAVQQARLQLSSGDARAAAMSFFEARRASTLGAQRPELTSAEADAHLHADDRKQALKLLRELEEKKSLGPIDHVNYGVALLSESGQSEPAREHFEAAYEKLGEVPRVVAGLALARQRCGDLDGARELLESELELDKVEDRTARDLAKRARKGLKSKSSEASKTKKKKSKGKDKKGAKKAPEVESEAKADAPTKSKKKDKKNKPKGKKARRAARREARKQREAEERKAKAKAREQAERQAKADQQRELDRAAAKARRASQVRTIPAEMPLKAPVTPASTRPKAKPPVPVVGSISATQGGRIEGASATGLHAAEANGTTRASGCFSPCRPQGRRTIARRSFRGAQAGQWARTSAPALRGCAALGSAAPDLRSTGGFQATRG